MKRLILITSFMLAVFSGMAWGRIFEDTAYENCILDNMQGVESEAVSKVISRICSDFTSGKFQISSAQLDFDQCLLDHIEGTESEGAVNQIEHACKRVYSKFLTQ